MEAKNFRIGNLVNHKNDFYEILEIDQEWMQLNNSQLNTELKEIKLIILDESWLIKLGFNKGEQSYLWKRTSNGFTIEFETGNGVVNCYLERVGLDVIHVHELQNLFFALTGTELELKNEP